MAEDWDGIDYYLLAGVATWPSFFRVCAERLAEISTTDGRPNGRVRVLYPYGDHTRSLPLQLRDIARDMRRSRALGDTAAKIARIANAAVPGGEARGIEAAADVVRRESESRRVVLIGHSGGGVAAYHIALRLLAEGQIDDCRIVQIGSPKVRIRPDMRARVGYFYGVNAAGRRDPVTRIGSWGEVRRSNRGLPMWDAACYMPGTVQAVTIVGGHADYFRSGEPYVIDGESNLDRTIRIIQEWLTSSSGIPTDEQPRRTARLE